MVLCFKNRLHHQKCKYLTCKLLYFLVRSDVSHLTENAKYYYWRSVMWTSTTEGVNT